jgi:primosomal protein N'
MELCPKCKSDYLKPTDDPRKLKCHFCGRVELNLTLKQCEDWKRTQL